MKRPPRSRQAARDSATLCPLATAGASRGSFLWDPEDGTYTLEADGIGYRVVVGPADEQSSLLRVEGRVGDGPWLPLVSGAGMLLREGEGAILPPYRAAERLELESLTHRLRGRNLLLDYQEDLDGQKLTRSLEIKIAGRSLEVELTTPEPVQGDGYAGFSLGDLGSEGARRVQVPGLPDPLLILEPEGFFCAYADRCRGDATAYPPGGAFYRPDSEGTTAPIRETFYLTLSTHPLGPLPGLWRPAAPLREALQTRVTLDFFSQASYAEDRRLLERLARYGLKDVLLVYRNWQQFGYDRRVPLWYPANPDRGSNDEFRELMEQLEGYGWTVALREEYFAMAPDSPYFDEKALACWPDGTPRRSRRTGDFAISAARMLDYARLESTKIQRNYRPAATFVEGHTAWNPETGLRQVDSAPASASGTECQAVRHVEALLAFLRDVHEGPIIGAGGEGTARFDTFAAGIAEGVIRGPDGGRSAPLVVDYEQREVRPRLIGIGAGSYRQFCQYASGEAVNAGQIDWDAYRATEIALGHAGYVGNYRIKPGPRGITLPGGSAGNMVREYYLLRALQELYLDADVKDIAYLCGDAMLPLAEALRSGADLAQARVRIEYGNDLTVWVNRSSGERWEAGNDDLRLVLPPSGFLALAPRQRFVAYSALVNGSHTDYCRAPSYAFLDVRGGAPRTVEGIQTDGAAVVLPSSVPGRRDLVLVNTRQLQIDGEEYLLSERADVRLVHRSAAEIEITVLDTESGKPIHVVWPAGGGPWRSGRFTILEWEAGAWHESRAQIQPTRTGPQLSRARPGVPYRITAD